MGATQRNAAHGSGGDPREAGRGEAGGGEDDPVCPASEPDGLGVRFPSPSALDIAPESTRNDQDAQKADNSPVPTHLWEFFFEHTYQAEFGELPGKWRQSLDGFRRLQLRWWRHRKLAATFRQWRLRHYPLPNLRRSDKLSWSLLRTVQESLVGSPPSSRPPDSWRPTPSPRRRARITATTRATSTRSGRGP